MWDCSGNEQGAHPRRPSRENPVTTYRCLASLQVQHGYFADGLARAMRLQADAESEQRLQRFGLLLRHEAQRIALYLPRQAEAGLWSELQAQPDLALDFGLYCSDTAWAYYTDLRALGASPRFKHSPSSPGLLQADGDSPIKPNFAPGRLAELQIALNPYAQASLADWAAQDAPVYQLTLPVRRTIWKYLMLGQDSRVDVRLVDVGQAVDFTEPVVTELESGHPALLIRSQAPLALQERPSHRFQLRKRVGNSERVLIARLPMATPAALQRELIDGELCDVSEIFVNR